MGLRFHSFQRQLALWIRQLPDIHPTAEETTGIQVGHGVQLSAINTIFTAGDRLNTGNTLDMAIDGTGFFQVQRPTGEIAFTRDGRWLLAQNGEFYDYKRIRTDRICRGERFQTKSDSEIAIPLYESFIKKLSTATARNVATGEFGAMMDIQLINSGPVTIIIDSKSRE